MGLIGNTVACPGACASMSVPDIWACAYTMLAVRPLPPGGNRLPVAVESGAQIRYEAKAKEA